MLAELLPRGEIVDDRGHHLIRLRGRFAPASARLAACQERGSSSCERAGLRLRSTEGTIATVPPGRRLGTGRQTSWR